MERNVENPDLVEALEGAVRDGLDAGDAVVCDIEAPGDAVFYARDHWAADLDERALRTIRDLVADLGRSVSGGEAPVVLDLLAGWRSHLPLDRPWGRVVGLGVNPNELAENPSLTDRIVHDVNRTPRLPLDPATFDLVLNVISVEQLTRPDEIFGEVSRVLKPGGVFAVLLSDRSLAPPGADCWNAESDEGRVDQVRRLMAETPCLQPARVRYFKGAPRARDDRYARQAIHADPVYAIIARKRPVAQNDQIQVRRASGDPGVDDVPALPPWAADHRPTGPKRRSAPDSPLRYPAAQSVSQDAGPPHGGRGGQGGPSWSRGLRRRRRF